MSAELESRVSALEKAFRQLQAKVAIAAFFGGAAAQLGIQLLNIPQ